MPYFHAPCQDTASATLFAARIDAPTTTPVRGYITEYTLGSEATPGDTALLWEVKECTGVPTGTSVTAVGDPDAGAAVSEVLENCTANGTEGTVAHKIPINQRATFRWVAAPGGELIFPATDNNGFGWEPTTSTGIAVTVNIGWRE